MEQHIDCIIAELIALKEEITNYLQTQTPNTTCEPPEESCKQITNLQTQNPNPPEEPCKQITDNNSDVKPIRRRTNRSFPLNRSKFLNEEQRDQVLQFAFDNKDEIIKQSRSNRITFLQNLVREKLNINLSLYMTGKVIQIIQS